jgi:hypothetical protein
MTTSLKTSSLKTTSLKTTSLKTNSLKTNSFKTTSLKPKCIICGLKEVKVMRHTDLGKTDKYASDLESKESNTGNILKKLDRYFNV